MLAVLLVSLYVLFWPDPAGGGAGPPGSDKVVHLALFAALAAAARARFGSSRSVLAAVVAYAVVSELVQALLLARRSGDLLDLVADLAGIALGWWLGSRLPER